MYIVGLIDNRNGPDCKATPMSIYLHKAQMRRGKTIKYQFNIQPTAGLTKNKTGEVELSLAGLYLCQSKDQIPRPLTSCPKYASVTKSTNYERRWTIVGHTISVAA